MLSAAKQAAGIAIIKMANATTSVRLSRRTSLAVKDPV
jgi:hypothetical protein